MKQLDMNFVFAKKGNALEIDFDYKILHIERHEKKEVVLEYIPKDGATSTKIVLREQSGEDKEYLATYIVAELFSHILERNKDAAQDRMNEVYAFFTLPKTLELEKTIIAFLK